MAGSVSYSPYGTATATAGTGDLGFQGDYADPVTGLVDMGARWYDPSAGSFASDDAVGGSPLSSAVDGNPYAYTGGNPLTETDPTGHLVAPPPDVATLSDEGLFGALFALGFEAGWELGSLGDGGGYAMPGSAFGPLVSGMAGWQGENNYALGSMQVAAGPVLASLSSGGSAAAGGEAGASPAAAVRVRVRPAAASAAAARLLRGPAGHLRSAGPAGVADGPGLDHRDGPRHHQHQEAVRRGPGHR